MPSLGRTIWTNINNSRFVTGNSHAVISLWMSYPETRSTPNANWSHHANANMVLYPKLQRWYSMLCLCMSTEGTSLRFWAVWFTSNPIISKEAIFWVCTLCKQGPPLSRKSCIGPKLLMLLSWNPYRIARLINKGKLRYCDFVFLYSSVFSIIHKLIAGWLRWRTVWQHPRSSQV